MKAAVLVDTGTIEIQEVATPALGPDDVLIRNAYAGVCGSDLHAFRGKHPFRKPPVILGHEFSGTVAECGSAVTECHPGDRVTVMPLVPCQTCRLCRMGRQNICLHKSVPGVGAWPGSFAEYGIAKASVTYRLAPATPLQVGVLAEPLAVGIHGVFRQARVRPGDRVLVLGAGPIGILTAMAAHAAGAAEVAVTDILDFNLAVARDLCGAITYNSGTAAWEDAVAVACPDGFDVAMLCSGAPITVRQAIAHTRRGGRIIVTGMFLDPVALDLTAVNLNELELVGSVVYDHQDFRQAVEWIDAGRFDFQKMVTHILPLDMAQDALALLNDRTEDAVKVLLEIPR